MYTTIVPTRPSDPYILEALQSIEEQSLPANQILVIINGDATYEGSVARDVPLRFPYAEIHHLPEVGAVPAIRHGLVRAKNQYIAFLDSDDIWLPHKMNQQISILEADDLLDAVCGGVVNFCHTESPRSIESPPVIARLFSSTTFRQRAFEKSGPPNTTDDHFNYLLRWWSRATKNGVITHSQSDSVLLRRVHTGSSWVDQYDVGMSALFKELRHQVNEARSLNEFF